MTLQRSDLHGYQHRAAEFVQEHPRAAMLMDMGTGKTSSVLTALVDMFNNLQIRGALIIAPRRVAETVWVQEAEKWAHTRHLRICLLRGASKATLARRLQMHYHAWVINYEALPWLFTTLNQLFLRRGRYLPFDTLILDELTRVKNSTGKRIAPWHLRNPAGYKMLDHFPRRIGLTGTPAPNGYWDLYGQFLALDDGARLGVSQQIYKEQYFIENIHTGRKVPAKGAKELIQQQISDITMSIQAKDHLDLPPVQFNDITIDLPPKARQQYDQLESDMFMELDQGAMEVFNAAALTAKCRQVANGIVKDTEDPTVTHIIHDAKLEALDDVMEEAAGQSVFLAYIFRNDMHRIKARYKNKYKVEYIGPGVGDAEAIDIVNRWNEGHYDLLMAHPQSAGHGLNLQFGGHQLVWFGLDYALEGYLQTNARLCRQGQPSPYVIIHRILARDTIDFVVKQALDSKESDQQNLRDALDAYKRSRARRLKAA